MILLLSWCNDIKDSVPTVYLGLCLSVKNQRSRASVLNYNDRLPIVLSIINQFDCGRSQYQIEAALLMPIRMGA